MVVAWLYWVCRVMCLVWEEVYDTGTRMRVLSTTVSFHGNTISRDLVSNAFPKGS